MRSAVLGRAGCISITPNTSPTGPIRIGQGYGLAGGTFRATPPLFDRPTKRLAGVDEAGRFCTAAAKEYPAAMSKGLACPVVKALASRLAKSHRCIECTQLDDLFKWVDTMRAASNVIRDDAVVMPDYQCQSANLPTAMERG